MNIKKIITNDNIPDKPFFKMSELSGLLRIKPHEVNYWESEFSKVKSQRNKNGQKVFPRDDVLVLAAIKHLLHDKKYTIAGTKKILLEADELFSSMRASAEEKPPKQEKISHFSAEPDSVLEAAIRHLPSQDYIYNKETAQIYQENSAFLPAKNNKEIDNPELHEAIPSQTNELSQISYSTKLKAPEKEAGVIVEHKSEKTAYNQIEATHVSSLTEKKEDIQTFHSVHQEREAPSKNSFGLKSDNADKTSETIVAIRQELEECATRLRAILKAVNVKEVSFLDP